MCSSGDDRSPVDRACCVLQGCLFSDAPRSLTAPQVSPLESRFPQVGLSGVKKVRHDLQVNTAVGDDGREGEIYILRPPVFQVDLRKYKTP
jgi:hypothetical protein